MAAAKKDPIEEYGNYGAKFLEFWAEYPKTRKTNKPGAWGKWNERGCEKIADTIIANVRIRAREDEQWRRGYSKGPAVYLNQRGWEDDFESYKDKASAGGVAVTEFAPPQDGQKDQNRAVLNLAIMKVLLTKGGVKSDPLETTDTLAALLRQRNHMAAQMQEIWGDQDITTPEDREQYRDFIRGALQSFANIAKGGYSPKGGKETNAPG